MKGIHGYFMPIFATVTLVFQMFIKYIIIGFSRVDQESLPDLLQIPYGLLRYGFLHPNRITRYSRTTRVIAGILYIAIYVVPVVICIYEMTQISSVLKIMENAELLAGYSQVILASKPIRSYC